MRISAGPARRPGFSNWTSIDRAMLHFMNLKCYNQFMFIMQFLKIQIKRLLDFQQSKIILKKTCFLN